MEKMRSVAPPRSPRPSTGSPRSYDRHLTKESLERHLAALDVLSNAVSSNDTQENIGLRSGSSFLIDDILFPRPKVRKLRAAAQHRGSILDYHPAASGLNPSIPEIF